MLGATLKLFSLLICGSIGGSSSELISAVVSVITEICASDQSTASVIFASRCRDNLTFMDDVDRILRESSHTQLISMQVETEDLERNASLPSAERCNVLLISACSGFAEIYEALAGNALMQHHSPLLLVLLLDEGDGHLDGIFRVLWRANIHKVNALLADGAVMTFFPFTGTKCNDTTPVLVNRFMDGRFVHSTVDFFAPKTMDLHQCPVRVSTSNNSEPYIFARKLENGSYELHGRDIKLLTALSRALKFSVQFAYVGREGVLLENGTAQGALKTLIDGRADIAIADLWLKANRLKFIDASDSYITSTIALVIPPGAELTSFEKYVRPLDAYTWALLLLTIALALATIFAVRRRSRELQDFWFGRGVQDPYMNVLVAVVGGSQPVLPRKNFARFILMMFLLFCLVMRTLYQGSLYRFQQMKISHREVQSIDEMIERDFRFYVVPSILDLIEGQPRIYERRIVMTLEQRSLLYNKSQDPAFKGVFPRSLTGVMYSNQQHYNTSIDLICKEKFMTFSVVIYTRKGFFLLQALNEKIAQMQAAGLIEYWHSQIFDERYLRVAESSEPRATELRQLSGCFMLWLIGCGIGLVAFVCEISYARVYCAKSPRSGGM